MVAHLTQNQLAQLDAALGQDSVDGLNNYIAYYTLLASFGETYGLLAADVAAAQSLSGRVARAFASARAKESGQSISSEMWAKISAALARADFDARKQLADVNDPHYDAAEHEAKSSIDLPVPRLSRWHERAKGYLLSRNLTPAERERSGNVLMDIIDECGPVVEGYPTWHPLVSNHDDRNPETSPSDRCGYNGLDHTICFAHGFLTCPYVSGKKIVESVDALPHHPSASITAEVLDVPFYNSGVQPVLVRCEWSSPLEIGKMVPKKLAVPLMIEKELPAWKWSSRAERWETMRPYLLGAPHGSRSSLFVTQDTALVMKKVYMAMVESGMYGPLKMG